MIVNSKARIEMLCCRELGTHTSFDNPWRLLAYEMALCPRN